LLKLIELRERYYDNNDFSKIGQDDLDQAIKDGYTNVISHKVTQSYNRSSSRTIIATSIILSKQKGINVKL
jgi:hypothetical protein